MNKITFNYDKVFSLKWSNLWIKIKIKSIKVKLLNYIESFRSVISNWLLLNIYFSGINLEAVET